MERWTRIALAVLLAAALIASLVLQEAPPAWQLALLATTGVLAFARAFGWLGGAVAVALAAGSVTRPWAAADPLSALAGVEPVMLAAFAVAALGGGWIGRLERSLGTHRTVSRQAAFDPLTGLLNRTAFEQEAHEAIEALDERKGIVALLFVDLDRFKVVNDTYGHETGDELLRQVAAILRSHVREADLVGRLGGDEFTVLLGGLRERESAEAIARKLLELLNAPHDVRGRRIELGASIGIAVCPADGRDVPTLLKNADHAMYQVKQSGRNGVGFTTIESRVGHDRRLELERQLHAALAEGEFELHYQPKVDLVSGSAVGVEMLLRWRNPKLGFVSPDEFVPMAEETGMILPLGRWLLRQACFQLRDWDEQGLPRITLAVNVSTLQFRQPDFVAAVEDALRDSGIAPDRLELEVTETVLMTDYVESLRTLMRLSRLGVRIAMDDFGTGYSSLAYLQNLPIRTLKIDRSFVAGLRLRGLEPAGGTGPIVETSLTLGRKLDLEVVAEGIETREQMAWLRQAGCPYGQGYLFCKPYRADRIAKLLARSGRSAPERIDMHTDGLLLTN
jgi:diguanylate cyclase (GGDEF)-like protein